MKKSYPLRENGCIANENSIEFSEQSESLIQDEKLRQRDYNPRDYQIQFQNQNLQFKPSNQIQNILSGQGSLARPNGKKDLSSQFQRIHQKMHQSKNKRPAAQQIAVPLNREALLLKYGQLPQHAQIQRDLLKVDRIDKIASYKVDAMRLIINRIYKYIGNVFEEMQRKVMRDDIMRQRREIYELMRPYNSKRGMAQKRGSREQSVDEQDSMFAGGRFGDENNSSIVNLRGKEIIDILSNQDDKEKQHNQKFRRMFEERKRRIQDSLHEYELNQIDPHGQYLDNIIYTNSQDSLFLQKPDEKQQISNHSIYETPGKDEILHIENYTQPRGEQIESLARQGRIQMVQFQDFRIDSGSRQRSEGSQGSTAKKAENNRYNSDNEDAEEEKLNESQRLFSMQPEQLVYNKNNYQTRHFQNIDMNYPIQEVTQESSPSYSASEQLIEEQEVLQSYYNSNQLLRQEETPIIKPAIKKNVSSYLQLGDKSETKSKLKFESKGTTDNQARQTDLVEMSFNENPFGRKGSIERYSSQNSSSDNLREGLGLGFQSTGGQNSPDFKRNISGLQSQQSLLMKSMHPSLRMLKHENRENLQQPNQVDQSMEKEQIEGLKVDQTLERKAKLKDQLSSIMNQFKSQEIVQESSSARPQAILCDDQQEQEPSPVASDSSQKEIEGFPNPFPQKVEDQNVIHVFSPKQQQILSSQNQCKQKSGSRNNSNQRPASKLEELKRRLGINFQNRQDEQIQQDPQVIKKLTKSSQPAYQSIRSLDFESQPLIKERESAQKIQNVSHDTPPKSSSINYSERVSVIQDSAGRSSKFQDSPIGKMLVLSENQVLFEESRDQNQEAKITREGNTLKFKQRQQELNSQLNEIKKLQEQEENDFKRQAYFKNTERFVEALQNIQIGFKKVVIVKFIRNQIQYSKLMHLQKLRQKLLKKAYFSQYCYKIACNKAQIKVQKLIEKKQLSQLKDIQKYFLQWQQTIKQQIKEQLSLKHKKLSKGIEKLSSIIQLKQTQCQKQGFISLRQRIQELSKEKVQQDRNLGLQIILHNLKRKHQKYLNKKFQKFRKITFRLAFDRKLVKFSELLNEQVLATKKDCFKDIINFCIRNDTYREQVELLSSEYIHQRNILATSQLNRMAKIFSRLALKNGILSLYANFKESQQKFQALKVLFRYFQDQLKKDESKQTERAFKKWIKYTSFQAHKDIQRVQSLKKIKLILSIAMNRTLKSRFDTWRQHTNYLLNQEMTKFSLEQTIIKQSKLEQIMINRLWCTYQLGFISIKTVSKLKYQLMNIIEKTNKRNVKSQVVQSFNVWRQRLYTFKIQKLSLNVLMKSLIKRFNENLRESFKHWKFQAQEVAQREARKIFLLQRCALLFRQYQLNQKRATFQMFQKWNLKAQILKKLLSKRENQYVISKQVLMIKKWSEITQKQSLRTKKAMILEKMYRKSIIGKQFWQWSKIFSNRQKLKRALHLIDYHTKQHNLQQENQAFSCIREFYQVKKLRTERYIEGAKRIIRIKKSNSLKDKQRVLIKWKFCILQFKQGFEQQNLRDQLIKKVLTKIISQMQSNFYVKGFSALRQNLIERRMLIAKTDTRKKNGSILNDMIQRHIMNNIRSAFLSILKHSNEIEQQEKIARTISKLSSVSKICSILDKLRRDREFFYVWKNSALRIQAFEFGIQVLDFQFKKNLKFYFGELNKRSQLIGIQKARWQIAANMIQMNLLKKQKEQMQKAFYNWLSTPVNIIAKQDKIRKSSQPPPLPPRTHFSIVENSAKKKKVELLFMLPPTPGQNQSSQMRQSLSSQRKILSHHSKSNSGNNSVTSQKNLRYSQQDEEEEEMYYDYERINLDTNQELNNSSEQMVLIKPKMSFIPNLQMNNVNNFQKDRDSLFATRSASNTRKNRYDNQSSPERNSGNFEIFQIAPLNRQTGNQELEETFKNSLLQFLQDEDSSQYQRNNKIKFSQDSFNLQCPSNEGRGVNESYDDYGYKPQNQMVNNCKPEESPSKRRNLTLQQQNQQDTQRAYMSKNIDSQNQRQSRNSKVGSSNKNLNKYLSSNSTQQQISESLQKRKSLKGSQKVKQKTQNKSLSQKKVFKEEAQEDQAKINLSKHRLDMDMPLEQPYRPQPQINTLCYKLELMSDSESSQQIISNPRKSSEEETLQNLLKNQSQSKLLSPRELEPVPEIDEIKVQPSKHQVSQMSRGKQKQNFSANQNLSNFLSASSTSRSESRTTQERKIAKQRSKENSEKFKMFLNKSNKSHLGDSSNQIDAQSKQGFQNISNIRPPQIQAQKQKNSGTSSSNLLSYTTSIERFQNVAQDGNPIFEQRNQRVIPIDLNKIGLGIQKLHNFLMKKVVISIAEHAFSPQQDAIYQQRKSYNYVRAKIWRLIEIKDDLSRNPENLKMEAFFHWRRLDYLIMLQSLNMFQQNLSNQKSYGYY